MSRASRADAGRRGGHPRRVAGASPRAGRPAAGRASRSARQAHGRRCAGRVRQRAGRAALRRRDPARDGAAQCRTCRRSSASSFASASTSATSSPRATTSTATASTSPRGWRPWRLRGGIAVSAVVREQIGDHDAVPLLDLGERVVKAGDRPLRAFAVEVSPAAAGTMPCPPGRGRGRPSIAVLPFVNLGGDPDQDYFAEGIAEDLITELSKISGLFVAARQSSFALEPGARAPIDVAARLGVGHVLEGSVRRAGDRLRLTVRLVDGATGGQVWTERYDRTLTDIFAVQDEITRSIVGGAGDPAAAGGATGAGPPADRQPRGLQSLSARAVSARPPCPAVLRARAPDVRARGRAGPGFRARAGRDRGVRHQPLHALRASRSHLDGILATTDAGHGAGAELRRRACRARRRAGGDRPGQPRRSARSGRRSRSTPTMPVRTMSMPAPASPRAAARRLRTSCAEPPTWRRRMSAT